MKTLIFTRGANAIKQIQECKEYASSNGLEIVVVVDNEKDLTVSVLGGGIECVIVSHASRISRSRKEFLETERMLNRFGVKLIAAEGETL